MDFIPIIVTSASYLLRLFVTSLLLVCCTKNHFVPIFIPLNTFTSDGGNICPSIQHYSAILLSWLLELANVKSLTLSSNILQVLHFLLLLISKFCEKCMTIINPNSPSSFLAFHRFSPLFLIYSRLNSLPCVTWSHCKSK